MEVEQIFTRLFNFAMQILLSVFTIAAIVDKKTSHLLLQTMIHKMPKDVESSGLAKVTHCSVELIVKNYKRCCRHLSTEKLRSSLSVRLKNILLNTIVQEGLSLDLSNSRLPKIYGFTNVIIKKCLSQHNDSKGLISSLTTFHVESFHSSDFLELSHKLKNLEKLGGLQSETNRLCRIFHFNRTIADVTLHRPIGVILHGPSGCGKSSLGNLLALECDAVILNVEADDLQRSDYGEAPIALQQIFSRALSLLLESPVILLMDDIDTLCPRSEKASLGSQQITHALIAEIDKLQKQDIRGLLVIATTNSIASVHPVLRRPGRFDQEILISVPTISQRISILQQLTSQMTLASSVYIETLASQTPGFVGADLRLLCEEALNHAFTKCPSYSKPTVEVSDFEFALYSVSPSLKKGSDCVVDFKPVHWDSIGGLEAVKDELKQAIEWPLMHPDILKRMDLSQTKGILLYGPPGCCKTTLVKAVATSCHVNFLCLNGAQVYSAYVGESEKIVSEAFHKAQALAPSILFIDEIESLVGKRSSEKNHSRVQERILATMLNEMDGIGTRLDDKTNASESDQTECDGDLLAESVTASRGNGEQMSSILESHEEHPNTRQSLLKPKVIVVGATNRPDMLDAAILRPGRLDKHMYIPPPDVMARKEILRIFTSSMTSDLDLDSLSQETDFYTGADLKNLCKEAGLLALRENFGNNGKTSRVTVTHSHFCKALATVKASLTEELIKQYSK